MLGDFLLILPEAIIAVASLVLMIIAAWIGDRSAAILSWIAIAAIVAAGFLIPGGVDGGGTAFGGLFVADRFAAFSKVLIYVGSIISLVAAISWFGRDKDYRAEYPVLILFAVLGMSMLVSARDLLTLYVGLEIQSLASYVLASFQRTDSRSAEAGLKYFVLGALASGILLYGVSLLYGFTGTTRFDEIAAAFGTNGVSVGELFGLVFLFAGIAFKISAVPFHMWTPDVYEGAPTPVTTFFASAPKIAAVSLLVRVSFEAMGPAWDAWQQIIIFMALASTILGAVAAIGQKNIKRLLAYSSINNVGFALVGLAAATPQGASSVLFYMAVYMVMTLGAFFVVIRMRDAEGQPVETIASMSGLSRTRPALAFAMAVFMFSLAGIPPLFGFWPKFLVFNAAVAADLAWLAAVAIVTSVVGAYYYIMIVKLMYFDAPAPAYERQKDPVFTALILVMAILVSPLGYLSIPMLDSAANAAVAVLF